MIVSCVQQKIPLRGHCDSVFNVKLGSGAPHGNFGALLQFRIAAGDAILNNHLPQSSRNAIYISSHMQKQILDVLGSTVVRIILHKVKSLCYYTIIANDVTDFPQRELD